MVGKFFQKPGAEQSDRVPPGQYLTKGFPVLTYGQTPQVNIEGWQFRVWGLAKPATFTWSDFMALPQHDFTADFHCVTRWSRFDNTFTGVRFIDLMKELGVAPKSGYVMLHGDYDYTTNLALSDLDREDVLLAHSLDGEPLTAKHGYPLRFIVPHLYLWKSVKWVRGIEFIDDNQPGFWEQNGFHMNGDPFQEERFSGEDLEIPEDEWEKKDFD